MVNFWIVSEPDKVSRCVFGITGRGQQASQMLNILRALQLPDTLLISIEPIDLAWYSQPISSVNQDEAIADIPASRHSIEKVIESVQDRWNLQSKDVSLLGYSAGGVMAIDIGTKSGREFGSISCLAGSILEPKDTPKNATNTPFLLIHNEDDLCFEWFERYLPMKQRLIEQDYNVITIESRFGGHGLYLLDIINTSNFIGKNMIDDNWQHPKDR